MSTKISNTFSLPLDFVTSTQAILAKKGSGKSYTASVQAEELLEAHQQIVAVDPTGAWSGAALERGRQERRLPDRGARRRARRPSARATAGEVIADAIAGEHFSAILDLSLFRKGEALRFMATFLETLYRKNRDALHLFIDEADVVAPQKTFGPDEARVLGATEDIVRRGRIRGIGCTLITQRPQVLNKNVLSQVDMLTALRMNHPKDLGAIDEWVAVHGDEAQAKRMMATCRRCRSATRGSGRRRRICSSASRSAADGRSTAGAPRRPASARAAPKRAGRGRHREAGRDDRGDRRAREGERPKALKARVAELERQLQTRRGSRTCSGRSAPPGSWTASS
jgi:DNA helicase HerA-like ATPase